MLSIRNITERKVLVSVDVEINAQPAILRADTDKVEAVGAT